MGKIDAQQIIKNYKASPEIQAAFTLSEYEAYVSNPESSKFKIIDAGGQVSVIENKNRQLSGAQSESIINEWKNDESIRAEFKTFNCFRAYREAELTGKAKIIGASGEARTSLRS
jgi:hypothetical protein